MSCRHKTEILDSLCVDTYSRIVLFKFILFYIKNSVIAQLYGCLKLNCKQANVVKIQCKKNFPQTKQNPFILSLNQYLYSHG